MAYFAELDSAGVVQRVIVAESAEWCVEHLGGTWEETADPYAEPGDVAYAGPGHGFDPEWPCRFAPQWVQPQPGVDDRPAYQAGAVVWHDGHLWVSTIVDNVWTPGEAGWRRTPTRPGMPPVWTQPSGSIDPWKLGEHVLWPDENGDVYHVTQTDGAGNNVWPPDGPGAFGWTKGWKDSTGEPGYPEWKPWDGQPGSLYQIGDRVTWQGQVWESTTPNNHWQPGEFGWVVVP